MAAALKPEGRKRAAGRKLSLGKPTRFTRPES
jgi:hypothetical protein